MCFSDSDGGNTGGDTESEYPSDGILDEDVPMRATTSTPASEGVPENYPGGVSDVRGKAALTNFGRVTPGNVLNSGPGGTALALSRDPEVAGSTKAAAGVMTGISSVLGAPAAGIGLQGGIANAGGA